MINRVRQLGDSQVAAVGLGAMPLSLDGAPDARAAVALIHEFIDHGGNFIDTANVYSAARPAGDNERLIAHALAGHPEGHAVRIASKGGVARHEDGWRADGRPQALLAACEQSLRDLQLERIFLYQLHAPDPDVPISESVGALLRLQEAGKIAHIGLSNVSPEQLQAAAAVAPITSVQNRLNPRCKQSLANGMLDHCRAHGISFIAHSPVGGYHHYRRLGDDPEMQQLAADYQTTPANLGIAWLLHLDEAMIVIAGARRSASLLAARQAMDLQLDAETIQMICALADW